LSFVQQSSLYKNEKKSLFPGLDIVDQYQNDCLDIARCIFLWKELFKDESNPPMLDVRSLQSLSPIEAIITLNAFNEVFEDFNDDPHVLWKMIHYPTAKLPLGTKIHLLTKIGFSLDEIRTMTMARMSSKKLPYTSNDYVPIMKERLNILRTSADKNETNATELMQKLVSESVENIGDAKIVDIEHDIDASDQMALSK
jgi:hypothetical protein